MRPGRSSEKILEEGNSPPKTSVQGGKQFLWAPGPPPGVQRLSREKGMLGSGKKLLTPTQVVSHLVRERHEVCAGTGNTHFSKLPHRHLSSAVLNGLVNRVYSRSRLEEFTRPDPLCLRLDLRSRINTIIERGTTPKHSQQKRGKLSHLSKVGTRPSVGGRPSLTKAPLDPSAPGSSRKRESLEEQNHQGRRRRKLLTLQDFTEEHTLLRGLRAQRDCSLDRQKERFFVPSGAGGPVLSRLSVEDFFPERYKLVSKKDKEIVDSFNSHPLQANKLFFGRKSSQKQL